MKKLNLLLKSSFQFKKTVFLPVNLSYSFKNFTTEVKKETFSESEALEIVEAGVFEILKGAAKCQLDKLSRAASFKELGFDSLDQVELVVAMEEKFNINLTDDESLKIQSVLDAIQIIHKAFLSEHTSKSDVKETNNFVPKI